MAAVNQKGIEGARVSTVLFQSENTNNQPTDLFNVDDQCSVIVNTNIPQVVYEYYAIGEDLKNFNQIKYKNVQAIGTNPYSAMKAVRNSIDANPDRPASVVILTDGKAHQDVTSLRDQLDNRSQVLISAGIGKDISETDLGDLAKINIYEPDSQKVFEFSKRIITKMGETGALCADEG